MASTASSSRLCYKPTADLNFNPVEVTDNLRVWYNPSPLHCKPCDTSSLAMPKQTPKLQAAEIRMCSDGAQPWRGQQSPAVVQFVGQSAHLSSQATAA